MRRRQYHGKAVKRVALFMVVTVLAAAVSAWRCPFVSRADEVSDLKKSIEQKQQEIKDAQNQKKHLQSGLTDVKTIISELEQSKRDLAAYVTQLDANLSEIQDKIAGFKEMISQKEAEIVQTQAELDAAVAKEESQYENMKVRIKSMYERGDDFYFEAILNAKSFADMINRVDYVEKVAASDRRMLEEFRTTREYVEVCKAQLESEQELLEEAKKDVEAEETSLESLIAQKKTEIDAYEADISNREQLVREYEAELAAQDAEIKEMEKLAKTLQAQLEQANGQKKTYDGGMFAWPAPSYTRISDDYGMREEHPILKTAQMHNGVDMAAPGGSPILAAYNGTVVAAAYSSSMGNYIMIDHGDNLYTIYMHASKLYVSQGAEVVKGQKIAAVGTTGRSTGNHLHFGVRLNGSYVNPWNYLK
ncbi:MAG: peptidoglycan DD-metalloendopeptidase family protein [Lachnospiraceae bacterium]|nr:peptidoglycan DD-metalloendopeptidase family protein [Lachnospiraceae bacterium]